MSGTTIFFHTKGSEYALKMHPEDNSSFCAVAKMYSNYSTKQKFLKSSLKYTIFLRVFLYKYITAF